MSQVWLDARTVAAARVSLLTTEMTARCQNGCQAARSVEADNQEIAVKPEENRELVR
jgi:hypothetical protein